MIPTARKTNLVQQKSGDELLVYDLDHNRAICLNETSALVWQFCDGTNSPRDICKKLGKTLGAHVSEDLVWFALKQLHEEKLLNDIENFESRYSGLTRREIVKQIGLSAIVALPIVTALVAPSAVSAQSCSFPMVPNINACSQSCQCSSGYCCRTVFGIGPLCLNSNPSPGGTWGTCASP